MELKEQVNILTELNYLKSEEEYRKQLLIFLERMTKTLENKAKNYIFSLSKEENEKVMEYSKKWKISKQDTIKKIIKVFEAKKQNEN